MVEQDSDRRRVTNIGDISSRIESTGYDEVAGHLLYLLENSGEGLLFRDYGVGDGVEYDTLLETITKVGRDKGTPVITLDLNPEALVKSRRADRTELYREVVKAVLDGFEGTPVEESKQYQSLRKSYNSSFNKIYRGPRDNTFLAGLLMDPALKMGPNIEHLLNWVTEKTPVEYRLFYRLSTVPALPRGTTSHRAPLDLPLAGGGDPVNEDIATSLELLADFVWCNESIKRGVIVPGWLVDILEPGHHNPAWDNSKLNTGTLGRDLSGWVSIDLS